MTTAPPMNVELSKLLNLYELNLLTLARRQFVIEAFTSDLDRIPTGRTMLGFTFPVYRVGYSRPRQATKNS
jgi:hypothetical protein